MARSRLSRVVFRLLKLPPRLLYAVGFGPIYGKFVLLLTTRGRRTGRARITPLQYERVNGTLVVASARGVRADWFRNVTADPSIKVRVGGARYSAVGETSVDIEEITEFLELRLRRHPRMIGGILRLRGVNPRDRSQLEAYASRLAMVTIKPAADAPVAFT